MSENEVICSSCQKNVANSEGVAKFDCPQCGKTTVIRCKHCREIAAPYTCAECEFTGPN